MLIQLFITFKTDLSLAESLFPSYDQEKKPNINEGNKIKEPINEASPPGVRRKASGDQSKDFKIPKEQSLLMDESEVKKKEDEDRRLREKWEKRKEKQIETSSNEQEKVSEKDYEAQKLMYLKKYMSQEQIKSGTNDPRASDPSLNMNPNSNSQINQPAAGKINY